jgi:membrane-associated protein
MSYFLSSVHIPGATDLINLFVSWLGPFAIIGVLVVVFAETGLLIGFFLPGDSLLFMLGVFVSTGTIKAPVWLVLVLVPIFAILGVQSGYFIGRRAGEKIFDKPDSKFFKKEYANRAKNFYKKYGAATVFLAQFVPIMRTFSPVAAGIGKMKYHIFFMYNVFASIVWGVGFPLLGMWLGKYEFVSKRIDLITVIIILISVLPIIIKAVKNKNAKEPDNTLTSETPEDSTNTQN